MMRSARTRAADDNSDMMTAYLRLSIQKHGVKRVSY
jgi:hypothetical protein